MVARAGLLYKTSMIKSAYPTALAVLVLVGFGSAVGYGIINLDDPIYLISRAPNYSFGWAFSWTGDAMWTPLTWISYWFDHAMFGSNWGMFHLHNIILHIVGSVLLYLVLRAIFPLTEPCLCFLAAAIWAIHPLRVESVAWLASRKDVLCNVFFFSALLVWIKANGPIALLSALLLTVLSAAAKPSAMLFFVFVTVVDFLITGKKRHCIWYVAAFVLSAAIAIEAGVVQSMGNADFVASHIPFLYKVLNAACAISIYFANVVSPFDLAPQCTLKFPEVPRHSIFGFVLAATVVFCLSKFIMGAWRNRRLPQNPIIAGLGIFSIALIPYLGISGFGCHAFADRFTILPCVGISIAAVGSFNRLPLGTGRKKNAVRIASVVLPIALCIMTARQTAYWKDDLSLFEHTLKVDGDRNLIAHQIMIVHEYEFSHDFGKIFSHAHSMMSGSPWQMFMTAQTGPILLEAAYETGHREEAEKIYDWQLAWGKERVNILKAQYPFIEQTETMAVCDAIRLAYTPGMLQMAKKRLSELQHDFPDNFLVKNLNYIIARIEGDPARMEIARKSAYAPQSGEPLLHNRWAIANPKEKEIL